MNAKCFVYFKAVCFLVCFSGCATRLSSVPIYTVKDSSSVARLHVLMVENSNISQGLVWVSGPTANDAQSVKGQDLSEYHILIDGHKAATLKANERGYSEHTSFVVAAGARKIGVAPPYGFILNMYPTISLTINQNNDKYIIVEIYRIKKVLYSRIQFNSGENDLVESSISIKEVSKDYFETSKVVYRYGRYIHSRQIRPVASVDYNLIDVSGNTDKTDDPDKDTLNRMINLSNLKDKGLITDEEYKLIRSKILDEM